MVLLDDLDKLSRKDQTFLLNLIATGFFVTGQPLVSIAPLLTLEKIKLELITEKFANKIVDKSRKQGITLNPNEVQINFQIY